MNFQFAEKKIQEHILSIKGILFKWDKLILLFFNGYYFISVPILLIPISRCGPMNNYDY